jgi:SAM-dependent methyltransferase
VSLKTDLTKIIHNPWLARKVPGVLLARYAHFMVGRQLRARASSLDTSDLSRNHYGWTSVTEQFTWDMFCIQETNLINFTRTFATDHYEVAVEIGATSDMFLKHVKARRKIGINVLDACIEQLNRQGITGIKTDGQRMPIEDNEADLVICFETLEHVHNPISFLAELSRITKNRLLLSIPWIPKTNIRAKWYGMTESNGQPDSEYHIFEFDEGDFRKVLSHTDFKVSQYQKLINYQAKYDPFTNWCLRKYLYLASFPAIQAYVLEKNS